MKSKKKLEDIRLVPPVRAIAEEYHLKHWSPLEVITGLLAAGLTIALLVMGLVFQGEWLNAQYIHRYGLLGMAIISFLASSALSATAVPLPYWVLTVTLPGIVSGTYGIWSPVWVGAITAAGATAGQFVTYMIGYSGKSLARKISSRLAGRLYEGAAMWTRRHGSWAVFLMSVTLNPLHLPMTLAIASLRYPPHKFVAFGFLGQLAKSLFLAFAGYYGFLSLSRIFDLSDTVVAILLIVLGLVIAVAAWQLWVWILETRHKTRQYRSAADHARRLGKQLLVIGGPWGVQPARRWFNMPAHDGGDVCLDIDRRALEGHVCPVVASAHRIPFADKAFGAVFLSHVLEHLPTPQAACQAIEEMRRVADAVYIVYPSRQSIAAWVIRDHHLWVWRRGGRLYLQQRDGRGRKETLVVETENQAV